MECVGVLVHPVRPVADALEALGSWSSEHGLDLVQLPVGEQPEVAPPGRPEDCDLIAALGGDGTVLRALHAAAATGTPVLGIAYGSLGVLTTVPKHELRQALDQFAAGEYQAESLPALTLESPDGELGRAINDVVLLRRGATQLGLDVRIDDELYVGTAGDGMVVATPTGSSAYSMAAGGSILAGGLNGFICTPLAMHGGCGPPLVVPHDRRLSLALHPGHDGFSVQIDGSAVTTTAERFSITSQPDYARLVVLEGSPSGLTRLRDRGLISDSPRVLARRARAAELGDAAPPPV